MPSVPRACGMALARSITMTLGRVVMAFAWVLGTACGGDESGAAASGGTTGTDASAAISPRACGPGVRCTAGATCGFTVTDDITSCVCDPSGHFMCFRYRLPGTLVCLPGSRCGFTDGGGCTNANSFCTQNCTCLNGSLECSYDCPGSGREESGRLCDFSTCGRANETCRHEEGSCKYALSCASRSIGGQCR